MQDSKFNPEQVIEMLKGSKDFNVEVESLNIVPYPEEAPCELDSTYRVARLYIKPKNSLLKRLKKFKKSTQIEIIVSELEDLFEKNGSNGSKDISHDDYFSECEKESITFLYYHEAQVGTYKVTMEFKDERTPINYELPILEWTGISIKDRNLPQGLFAAIMGKR